MMEKFSPSPVFLGLIEITLQTRLGQSIIEEERKFGTLEGEILRKKEQIE